MYTLVLQNTGNRGVLYPLMVRMQLKYYHFINILVVRGAFYACM